MADDNSKAESKMGSNQESNAPRKLPSKITVGVFCNITGGIGNLDRRAVVKKFKKEVKSIKQWTEILTEATILPSKKK